MSTTGADARAPAAKPKQALTSFSLERLEALLAGNGFPRYRARQVMDWFYGKGVRDFARMENVSTAIKEFLEQNLRPMSSTLVATHDAGDGAVKLEIALDDSFVVEAVLIEAPGRVTLCVSSQVGCPLGCVFCATGAAGFARNLASSEIVEQILHAKSLLAAPVRITNVVFMGMGEPCLNLEAVFEAARLFNAPYALGLGARRITISTLGDPRCIERIGEFPLEVGLAVSLHAADDALRRRLIPAAPAQIEATLQATARYFEETGREVTYEYVLLAGVNDSSDDAQKLADLLAGKRAFVNLIMYNEVEGLDFKRPSAREAAGFLRALRERGINAHLRRSLGSVAHAACGQLRFTRKKGSLS